MSATSVIAAQQAILRTNIAMAAIKQNAQAEKTLLSVIEQAAQTQPAPSGGRGSLIDISA